MKLFPIAAIGGTCVVTDEGTSEPSGKPDGYVGVAVIGGQARIYFAVEDMMYFTDGTVVGVVPIAAGMPMGLTLVFTYAGP
ncbi:hypothetical protein LCGC14_1310750 [marine sediment metagenome]|uniref:Uncharacterized protein n=1 Tax=marine sediment metagenome TaxID=412755 RepID=A0A0F9N3N9_9ZZZZ